MSHLLNLEERVDREDWFDDADFTELETKTSGLGYPFDAVARTRLNATIRSVCRTPRGMALFDVGGGDLIAIVPAGAEQEHARKMLRPWQSHGRTLQKLDAALARWMARPELYLPEPRNRRDRLRQVSAQLSHAASIGAEGERINACLGELTQGDDLDALARGRAIVLFVSAAPDFLPDVERIAAGIASLRDDLKAKELIAQGEPARGGDRRLLLTRIALLIASDNAKRAGRRGLGEEHRDRFTSWLIARLPPEHRPLRGKALEVASARARKSISAVTL